MDNIIENGEAVADDHILTLLNLRSFGIKNENGKHSFIDTIDDIVKKIQELGIDIDAEEGFEICYKLKIHYKRWKKLRS